MKFGNKKNKHFPKKFKFFKKSLALQIFFQRSKNIFELFSPHFIYFCLKSVQDKNFESFKNIDNPYLFTHPVYKFFVVLKGL